MAHSTNSRQARRAERQDARDEQSRRQGRYSRGQAGDVEWFRAELEEKLDGIMDVWQDLGQVVGGPEYEVQVGGLLTLSVLAREAAACIMTRPPGA